ncbi:MAG: hypothetical protein DSY42_08505 [Aquifex sp.]|nr:MAG: hypothetical protein DSY42_08505 [Aquifex sp.]
MEDSKFFCNKYCETLRKICLIGEEVKNFVQFLEIVGEEVANFLGANSYSISEYKGKEGFRIIKFKKFKDLEGKTFNGNSMELYTLKLCNPVCSDNFSKETRFSIPNFISQKELRSGISIPVKVGNSYWGVLTFYFYEPRNISVEEESFLKFITEFISLFGERLELFNIYKILVNDSPFIMLLMDLSPPYIDRVIYANSAFTKLTGYQFSEIFRDWLIKTAHTKDKKDVLEAIEELKETGEAKAVYRIKRKDGSYLWVYGYFRVVEKLDKVYRVVAYLIDISVLKEIEEKINGKTELFKTIVDKAPVGIILYKDKIIYSNPYVSEITGYSPEELKKLNVYDLVEKRHKEIIKKSVEQRINCEKFKKFSADLQVITKEGEKRILRIVSDTVKYGNECFGLVIGIDITPQKRLEKKLLRVALYDNLTGLPNQTLFQSKLKNLIRKSKGNIVALFLIRITNIKYINAVYGLDAGDKLIKEVGKRLKDKFAGRGRSGETVKN